ncbi:MAG: ATP-binding cassette domain-containing protein [Finegoldia sp.]|nr:ATP-binding cassette domain-containing protein [Finegoldia sp.]
MELKIRNFKKSYGDKVIWSDLSADMYSGEIISVQGRSGEGKTTFLRALNGLEKLDDGYIEIDGKKINPSENTGDNRIFGMVFQNFNLFPHKTVWENLIFAPEFHKMNKDEITRKANDLLDALELTEHKYKLPKQLSGGQSQRVAIARASMLDPKVMCFDEPTSALDEESIENFQKVLEPLRQKQMIIIIVTHDGNFARSISDKILHIEDGKFREEVLSN